MTTELPSAPENLLTAVMDAAPDDPRVLAPIAAQQAELRALYADTTEVTKAFDPASLTEVGCVLLGAGRGIDRLRGAETLGRGHR